MYVRLHINTHVREQDIVRVMERFVIVNIQSVIARPIMCGMVAPACAIVPLSIPVVARAIVPEVGHHVGANIRVVIVPHIIVGMAVLVCMYIVMCVRAVIQPLILE